MKIAIHKSTSSEYSKRWIKYCKENNVEFKEVNAYDNDIIEQLFDCDVFMWHHNHGNYRDVNFAKQLLFALEQSGKKVFPNFNTAWHFDDKLGQKYLFEAHNIPAAEAFVFYDKESAFDWINKTSFPKIFKLRGGAGSSNVKMVKSEAEAKRLVKKAFGKGFKAFDYFGLAKDKFKLFLRNKASFYDVAKYCGLFLIPKKFNAHLLPDQKGYIYFQEFIPNDGYDIRIEITGDKAVAMIRHTRENDFRASGSNNIEHNTPLLNKEVILFAFDVAEKLQLQACALDIVRDNRDGKLYVIENSYCYGVDDDEFDYGYWTSDGIYHRNIKFNGLDWIFGKL
ncbi:ATP-grasp domain-containing protein [Myroides phaeus]|uniref:Phosphoribosylglycinamide synthetase, ATP-grasp (A) domain n=1 Tax=Myroides phaeus TaxID=702745 RepID=A0A1G8CJH7_9FLAO|nr:hypothetical protein [Myroides phaeus]SDH45542.1 Phosphoribosylglycinamide synthetase, ATP-grasp (A) domain [Myroides phaeus]